MSQENSILKSTLQTLYHDYTKDFLSSKLQKRIDQQVLDDIVQQLFITSKQAFLTNIIENIINVKSQNKFLKQQLAKQEEEYFQKLGMISSRIRKEYSANILTQKQTLFAIVTLVQQLLGQNDIVLGVKNLLNQNRMQKQSLLYRQQFIEKLHTQVKQAKNTQIKLLKEIENYKETIRQKQIQLSELSNKFIQKHKQFENSQYKRNQQLKIDEQCNQKIQILQNQKNDLKFQVEQNKSQLQSLNDSIKQLLQNEDFLNKRVLYLRQENQILKSKINEFRFKIGTIANNQQTNDIQRQHQQNIIKQLQINMHLTKQSSKQEIMKYQNIIDQNNKKHLDLVKQLKNQNQSLKKIYEKSTQDKSAYQKLLIDLKNKFQYDHQQINKKHNEEIQSMKFQLQDMQKIINQLKQQLSTKQQLSFQYQRNLKQTAQLKFQVQYLKKPGRLLVGTKNNPNLRVLSSDLQNNLYYLLGILKEQAKQLKKQNIDLKKSFNNQIKIVYQTSQKLICDLFVKVTQYNQFKCKLCVKSDYNCESENPNSKFNPQKCEKRTLLSPKSSLNPNIDNFNLMKQSNQKNHPKSKKKLLDSVKDLAKRYQTIEQQNKFFTNHIEKLYKK